MSQTIIGKFDPITNDDLEDTAKYLKELGMTFSNGIKSELFYIELKQLPDILFQLIHKGYLDVRKSEELEILKISQYGVVLYIASLYGGDGYIFLSNENIICIHTVSEFFLDTIRQ